MTNYKSLDELNDGLVNVFNKLSGSFSGALEAIKHELDKGDANAILNLGNMYYNGKCVELDKEKANYYYFISACMGHASAIMYVGNYYADVEKDKFKALVWYVIGAQKKYALSMSCVWRVLTELYLENGNDYCFYLATKNAIEAENLGYSLREKIPNLRYEKNIYYTKEEENDFKTKFTEVYEICNQEFKDRKKQIILDPDIPNSIKKRIEETDIFDYNTNIVITVEEPIDVRLGFKYRQLVQYLCDNKSVKVGDAMYYHHLNYCPFPVRVVGVTRLPLSVIEEMQLNYANFITWIDHEKLDHDTKKEPIVINNLTPAIQTVNNISQNKYTLSFKAAGVSFGNRQAVVNGLKVNNEIILEMEPTNQFDSNAVKLIDSKNGMMFGYVPKVYSSKVSESLRNGEKYKARVQSLSGGWNNYLLGVNIIIDFN